MPWASRRARRLKTSGARVSARTCGSTPHASISRTSSRLRRALRSVLRRCENAVGDHLCKLRGDRKGRLWPDGKARDGRPDTRRGFERAGTDVEQLLDAHPRGQHHGQASIFAGARCRGHAGHDFPLQHDVQVEMAGAAPMQPEQQRRRDVVGQVADDPQLPAAQLCQRTKSKSSASHSCSVAARARAMIGRRLCARSRSISTASKLA